MSEKEANWSDPYQLAPALPVGEDLEDLRDLASEVITGVIGLEAKLAPETAEALGERLRILNSLFSNQIEGYYTTYSEIEDRLGQAQQDPVGLSTSGDKYAAELGAAHVKAEAELVRLLAQHPRCNVSHPGFIRDIHIKFYSELPPELQYTHSPGGFARYPVRPGEFRDAPVYLSMGGGGISPIGPNTIPDLVANMEAFGQIFDPDAFRGGESRMIAAAAGHAKLAWLHPFRDGNGRTIRLYTSLFLARCSVNRSNLWSLSRGLAKSKGRYFTGLQCTNPSPDPINGERLTFQSGNTAAGCNIFLTICKEQIAFMEQQLMRDSVKARIEQFAETRLGTLFGKNKTDAGRVLRAVFSYGRLERQEVYGGILGGLGERTARGIIAGLLKAGYLKSDSPRAALTIGFPPDALQGYFPRVFDEAIMRTQGKGKPTPAAPKKVRSSGSGLDLER
ncbi:Fic family protein [Humidesulfovibrio sp.]